MTSPRVVFALPLPWHRLHVTRPDAVPWPSVKVQPIWLLHLPHIRIAHLHHHAANHFDLELVLVQE